MHDIRAIKKDPDGFDAAMTKRGAEARSGPLVALDDRRAHTVKRMNDAQAEQKRVSKTIGQAKASGDESAAAEAMEAVGKLKAEVKALEDEERALSEELHQALLPIPNVLDADVPDGADETSNVEIRRWGEPRAIADAKDHVDLGEALAMMDFEAAARLSGARFVVLRQDLAKLERAIATLMLTLHTEEFGYQEFAVPALVHADPMTGSGQLPKFEDDAFKTTGGHYLIPTAEVPLTGLMADRIASEDELPLRMTAWTQCFRAEAGSAGRDTRGMIRMHQFSKVELVSAVVPEASEEELDRMTACAEDVLKRLELPFRTMLLCAGDTGFGAAKTYDLEVHLPGQGQYREISSCSNTRDFQARRMQARYRPEGQKKPDFIHTLNGSGLAVGRTMVAILENYQDTDGSIAVPDALRPLMGKDKIARG